MAIYNCKECGKELEVTEVTCGECTTKKEFVVYNHHGRDVTVDKKLKGKHRDHCLCYSCEWFGNCEIAKKLYEFDVHYHVTTPVWECPHFEEKLDGK